MAAVEMIWPDPDMTVLALTFILLLEWSHRSDMTSRVYSWQTATKLDKCHNT